VAAIWLWARTDWRNRWGSLVGLALLIAFAGGVAVGVAGGARRAATAVDRWKAETNWHEVEVEVALPDEASPADLDRLPSTAEVADEVAAVRGVHGVQVVSWIGATLDEDGFFFAAALGDDRGDAPTQQIVRGRLPDPNATDEIVVNESAVEDWGVDVGDTAPMATLGVDQWEQFIGIEPYDPQGPVIDVRVVGVIRDLESITDRPEPFLIASSGFLERRRDEIANAIGIAFVNVEPGRSDEVVAALTDVGDGLFQAGLVDEDYASRIADTIDVEVTALWVFTGAAAVAGLVIVGQALLRHASRTAAEHRALSAMGFASRHNAVAAVLAAAPALVAGALGALAVAVAFSPLFPRGLARQAEIDPGVHVDGAVLGVGGLLLVAALVGAAFASGLVASRVAGEQAAARPSGVERLLAALPAVPALGARLTLARSRRAAAPAWAGAAAVCIGVGGVLAVTTVDRSVEHLLEAPALYGAPWHLQAAVDPGEHADVAALAADPDVEMVAEQRVPVGEDSQMQVTGPRGTTPVEPFTLDVALGPVPLVIEEGRVPGPGEAAVGAEILDRLGARIGDPIEIEGFSGPVRLIIAARTVNAGNDELDQGFYVPPETFEDLLADCGPDEDDMRCTAFSHGVGVGVRDGADLEVALERLRSIEPGLVPTQRPSVVDSLDEIGSTPAWLGGFLVLLGLAGFAHALVIGSRRSRRDLAIVRALGLRPRQAAGAIRWGAALITVAGTAVGVLLGLVAGRLVWQRVVEGVGALLETELSIAALVLAPVVAVAVSLVIAVFPGHRAATLDLGAVLRAE
jgi:hypothetical protein